MHPALENICIIDNHHCSITIKLMRVEYVQQKNQILHLPVNKLKLLMGVSDGDRRRGQVRYPPGRAGRLAIDCHGEPRDGQGGECEPELHLR